MIIESRIISKYKGLTSSHVVYMCAYMYVCAFLLSVLDLSRSLFTLTPHVAELPVCTGRKYRATEVQDVDCMRQHAAKNNIDVAMCRLGMSGIVRESINGLCPSKNNVHSGRTGWWRGKCETWQASHELFRLFVENSQEPNNVCSAFVIYFADFLSSLSSSLIWYENK